MNRRTETADIFFDMFSASMLQQKKHDQGFFIPNPGMLEYHLVFFSMSCSLAFYWAKFSLYLIVKTANSLIFTSYHSSFAKPAPLLNCNVSTCQIMYSTSETCVVIGI